MIIGFIYGNFAIGDRYFDLNNLWNSARGLTGSEVSYFNFAREMSRRGHEVHLFITGPSVNMNWEGCQVHSLDSVSMIDSSWDVAYSWHEPEILQHTHPKLRMVNQQLNDFDYCHPGYDQYVDVYTSPSTHHMTHVSKSTSSINKWEVLSNGCDLASYKFNLKVPGRVVYASSPDRGLHHILQVWPSIKRTVPEATLRIFYNLDTFINRFASVECHQYDAQRQQIQSQGQSAEWLESFIEFSCRARFIELSINRMKDMGVEKCGCISRKQINQEWSEAIVLAYPCDTIKYTEGFSVTTLEACASRTLPVISGIDALGHIYGSCAPIVQAPVVDHLDQFAQLVIKGLTDSKWRDEQTEKCYQFATQYSWPVLAQTLESIILRRLTGR
jgi:glycosyltransferase involved in cell wall biosynthesis